MRWMPHSFAHALAFAMRHGIMTARYRYYTMAIPWWECGHIGICQWNPLGENVTNMVCVKAAWIYKWLTGCVCVSYTVWLQTSVDHSEARCWSMRWYHLQCAHTWKTQQCLETQVGVHPHVYSPVYTKCAYSPVYVHMRFSVQKSVAHVQPPQEKCAQWCTLVLVQWTMYTDTAQGMMYTVWALTRPSGEWYVCKQLYADSEQLFTLISAYTHAHTAYTYTASAQGPLGCTYWAQSEIQNMHHGYTLCTDTNTRNWQLYRPAMSADKGKWRSWLHTCKP